MAFPIFFSAGICIHASSTASGFAQAFSRELLESRDLRIKWLTLENHMVAVTASSVQRRLMTPDYIPVLL